MRENDLCPELRKQSSQKSCLLIFPQSRLSYFSLIVRFYVWEPNSCLIAHRLRTSALSCTRTVTCVRVYTCGTLHFPFFAFSAGRKQPLGVAENEWTLSRSLSVSLFGLGRVSPVSACPGKLSLMLIGACWEDLFVPLLWGKKDERRTQQHLPWGLN